MSIGLSTNLIHTNAVHTNAVHVVRHRLPGRRKGRGSARECKVFTQSVLDASRTVDAQHVPSASRELARCLYHRGAPMDGPGAVPPAPGHVRVIARDGPWGVRNLH